MDCFKYHTDLFLLYVDLFAGTGGYNGKPPWYRRKKTDEPTPEELKALEEKQRREYDAEMKRRQEERTKKKKRGKGKTKK